MEVSCFFEKIDLTYKAYSIIIAMCFSTLKRNALKQRMSE